MQRPIIANTFGFFFNPKQQRIIEITHPIIAGKIRKGTPKKLTSDTTNPAMPYSFVVLLSGISE